MKSKKNAEDIVIEELEKSFIEDYYNWMLGTCALANSTVFGRVNTLKWLMYIAQEKRLDTGSSVRIIRVYARIQEAFFPFRRGTAKDNPYRTEIQTPACHARHVPVHVLHRSFLWDLKAITYDNIHTDSDGGTWLMGNRIKTGVAYVVKLLPIAIELIEKYRGTDEKKDSPECVFPVGEYNAMRLSLGIIGRKCNSGRGHPAHRTPRICRSGHTQGDAAGNSSESVWA